VERLRLTGEGHTALSAALGCVLRDSLVAEANGLDDVAERLNGLLGPAAAKLDGSV
jgi:hypothetical protein